ncbi:ribosomal protein L7/L12 [Bacillus sp. 1P10SD]|uniref:ribosomal protein L7/L12 n=1 Tax=Bacillus sp. 1P10SD TaxID=3132265 RepID=UPI0039A4862F
MGELLTVKTNTELKESDKAEIDRLIEQTIAWHSKNGAMIIKLTMDSVTALTASESRAKELAQQSFFKRAWNNLTGKNQKIRAQIDVDVSRVQYASQQMIQKLAEQNLLTFDLITAVNNKLNTLVLEIDEEFNQIYRVLGAFFKQTRSDVVQLENRLDKVERNLELLNWKATIEYQMYDGKEYAYLPDMEKIICIANDFLHKTKGIWSTTDLMLLKSTLAELGLSIKQSISARSFYQSLSEKPILIERLFDGISLDSLLAVEPYQAPVLKGIEKTLKLHSEEKYILESVKEQLHLAGVSCNERDIQLSLVHQYLKNHAYMNSDVEVNLFDFVVELLVDLNMIHTAVVIPEESGVENKKRKVAGDYDLSLIDMGENRLDVIEAVKNICEISLIEAKECINHVPSTILSRVTKKQANEARDILIAAGAKVIVKTYIENVHIVTALKDGYVKLKAQGNFVRVGEYVQKGTILAEISDVELTKPKPPSFLTGGVLSNHSKLRSTVSGKVSSLLVQNGEKVVQSQPIMVILIEA